jgi:hypothetical protein
VDEIFSSLSPRRITQKAHPALGFPEIHF